MKTSKSKTKSLMLVLFLSVTAISTASARVCFLPDSTDCGSSDVNIPDVPCKYYNCKEAGLKNEAYQTCYDERTYNNGGVNVNCKQVKCNISKSDCEAQAKATSQSCKFDDASGCYYLGECKQCNKDLYDLKEPKSGSDWECDSCTGCDGTFYSCTAKKECYQINSNYTSKCADSQIAHEVKGVKDSHGNQCYTCESKQPDPGDADCYDTVVTIECLRYGRGGCNHDCADEKCSTSRNDKLEFSDGETFSNSSISGISSGGYLGPNVCRIVAKGADAAAIYGFYYKLEDGSYSPCVRGQTCVIDKDTESDQVFQLEYLDPKSKQYRRVDIQSLMNANDASIVISMKNTENDGLVVKNEKIGNASCKNNEFYKRNIPEMNVCNEDKTTITIKTKDVIEGCTDDSWEDDNNGTLFTCVQKVTSSFKTQASDGNSYNVSLALNGRNLVTDSDNSEVTENVSSCQIFNYPLNIAENNETKTYTYGSCEIYTDDDNYYYDVEAGVKTLSVSVNGVQVLSGLTSPIVIEGTEFALLGDFDGKTYDAGNYTIKFVKTTNYCKDVNASYIGEQKSCLSTQDKIPVDGVTTEIDGQCYTCQTKAEYANTATLCCSLGYQERDYMPEESMKYSEYIYGVNKLKEGCAIYPTWYDAVNAHKGDSNYVSEYGSIPDGYPNSFGCPTYGMDGKWYIGWFGPYQSDYGVAACTSLDEHYNYELGNHIEGSLYVYSSQIMDGIYKQRLITNLLDNENYGAVCGENIQKWLDEHISNATMCRYNFTTVTQNDDAYYKIHAIGNSGSDMLNHCWYQDADGRDVTDQIEASKRAPAARNKIEPIDESKADDDYQVRTYAEKYNGDLVDACQGYSVNKDKLTPLTIDIKN